MITRVYMSFLYPMDIYRGFKGIPAHIQARAHGQRIAPDFVSVFRTEKKAFPIWKRVSVHHVKSQYTRGIAGGSAHGLFRWTVAGSDRGRTGRVYGRTYGRGGIPLSLQNSQKAFSDRVTIEKT
jgi:hypothetical protein